MDRSVFCFCIFQEQVLFGAMCLLSQHSNTRPQAATTCEICRERMYHVGDSLDEIKSS